MSDENMLHEEQFVISYELLHAIAWLLQYEEDAFAKLVTQAFVQGYQDKFRQQDIHLQMQHGDDIQNSILNLFNFLEYHVAMINNAHSGAKIMDQNIIKTLDQIDPKRFDYDTIKSTVLATADKIKPKDKDEAKRLFLKELLKQWKPKKEKNNGAALNH
jgi:hypothetical protein